MSSKLKLIPAIIVFAGLLMITGHAHTAKDLPNLYKVDEHIFRGGQPTEAGIRELKQMGIKTVINLRGDSERAKREAAWAQSAGLRFVNVPESNWFRPEEKISTPSLNRSTLRKINRFSSTANAARTGPARLSPFTE